MNYKKLSKITDSEEGVKFIYGGHGGGFPDISECEGLLSKEAFKTVQDAYDLRFQEEAEEAYPYEDEVDANFMYSETEADSATGFVSNIDPSSEEGEARLEGTLYWSTDVTTEDGKFYVGLAGV